MSISTHVLDTAKGLPVRGVRVQLERLSDQGKWQAAGHGVTDANGRLSQVHQEKELDAGAYRLTFYTAEYYSGQDTFYNEVTVSFQIHDPSSHYHVPLLLSPYGYTTYRGS